jgi:hypothetical protein
MFSSTLEKSGNAANDANTLIHATPSLFVLPHPQCVWAVLLVGHQGATSCTGMPGMSFLFLGPSRAKSIL